MIALASLLVTLLLPVATGAALVRGLLPPPRSPAERALAAAGAIAIGTGLHAAALYPWVLAGGRGRASLAAVDLCLLAGALTLALIRHGGTPAAPALRATAPERDRLGLGILAFSAAGTVACIAAAGRRAPWGGWDAVAIWNLKARFLARAPGAWEFLSAPELSWTHPDYPLLLPAAVARGWLEAGGADALPLLLAALFALAGALAAFGAAGAGSTIAGILAALAVLATPAWLRESAARSADVPLAAFVALSFGLLAAARSTDRRGPALLAGISAGLGAWTKNEGLLVVAALAASLALFDRRSLLAFVAGAAPLLVLVAIHKKWMAPAGYLLRENTAAQVAEHLADPSRWLLVARSLAGAFGGLALGVPLLAVAALAALGLRLSRPPAWALVALGLVVAGELAVYVVTPKDLAWQLSYSASRLALQLWPSIVALALAGARFKSAAAPEGSPA